MIYSDKKNAEEVAFRDLLERTKHRLVCNLQTQRQITPLDFENLTFENMDFLAKSTVFRGTIKQTTSHAFPDIIAKEYFGVEVKLTTKDHWCTTGNSIFETTRISNIERIFIMFGKLGGVPDVRFRLYQDCLVDISVTHSPRYRVDLELEGGETIFDKMGIEYDALRNSQNIIKLFKGYYRSLLKEDEELWWIDQDNEDIIISPIIKSLNGLEKTRKQQFQIESMILFPEIFSDKISKFERVAAYLITEYNAVSANLRDLFTAGGQKDILIKGAIVKVPKIYFHLYSFASLIHSRINSIDDQILLDYWRLDSMPKDKVQTWKSLLLQHAAISTPCSAVDIFEAGLCAMR